MSETDAEGVARRDYVWRYNAFGERVEKRTESGITRYHYDVQGRLLSETDAEGVARRDYVWRGRIPVASGLRAATPVDKPAATDIRATPHSPVVRVELRGWTEST